MKDGKKLTLGPSVLYFLPDSSIKALPFSSIRSIAQPLNNIIYLPAPSPNIIYLPSPLPFIIYPPAPHLIYSTEAMRDPPLMEGYTPHFRINFPDLSTPFSGIPTTTSTTEDAMPTYDVLSSNEDYIPVVMLPTPHPVYTVIPIMPTKAEDAIEMGLQMCPILIDHFNYIPEGSIPFPEAKRTGKKQAINAIISGKKVLSPKVTTSKKKSASQAIS